MAEEANHVVPKSATDEYDGSAATFEVVKQEEPAAVESTDRGLFDFLGKKEGEEEEKKGSCEEGVLVSEFEEKVKVSEVEKEEEPKKDSILAQFHRSNSSSSSSSSDEEVEEGGEKIKRKKKKGLKEKIKEKIHGDGEEKKHEEDTCVPVEKYDEEVIVTPAPVPPPTYQESTQPQATYPELEEKKGFLEKIKEKLPGGGHKKAEEEAVVAPPPAPVVAAECATEEAEGKEKKGIFEKIKEKLPGYHSKTEEEKKEKESY